MQDQLSDVIVSYDPDGHNPWTENSGLIWDVERRPEGQSFWDLAANWSRVGAGTVAWIHRRRDGGRLAALMMFTGDPVEIQMKQRVYRRCAGELRLLRASVPTARIRSHPDWSNKAPYTTNRATAFASGVQLAVREVTVLTSLITAEDQAWLAQARRMVEAGWQAGQMGISPSRTA